MNNEGKLSVWDLNSRRLFKTYDKCFEKVVDIKIVDDLVIIACDEVIEVIDMF